MAEESATLRWNPTVNLHRDSEVIPSRTERQDSQKVYKEVQESDAETFLIKSRIFYNIVLATLLSGDVVLACCST